MKTFIHWEQYSFQLIGTGSFGAVYKAVLRENDEPIAIKKIKVDDRFKVYFHFLLLQDTQNDLKKRKKNLLKHFSVDKFTIKN